MALFPFHNWSKAPVIPEPPAKPALSVGTSKARKATEPVVIKIARVFIPRPFDRLIFGKPPLVRDAEMSREMDSLERDLLIVKYKNERSLKQKKKLAKQLRNENYTEFHNERIMRKKAKQEEKNSQKF